MTLHQEPVFDEVIHAPVRLRICGLLRRAEELEFSLVRDTLGLSDAQLSKNLKVLTEAGYVALRKDRSVGRADRRRLTWVALTPHGQVSLDEHLAALRQILGEE